MNIFALLAFCVLQLAPPPIETNAAYDPPPSESLTSEAAGLAIDAPPVVPNAAAPEGLANPDTGTTGSTNTESDPTPPKEGGGKDDNKTPTDPKEQIKEWYNAVYQFITTEGLALLFKMIAAAAIFYFGRMLARMATKVTSEVMERVGTDPILVKFGANLLYCTLLVMIAIASLDMVGVPINSVTAMIAAAGFAVGLALQGSLANFAAGIMLIIFKPFGVGDEIEAGGQTGNVEEVNIFDTILRTNGNVKIIIPNGQITTGTIKNFTAQRIRLVELKIGCGYCDDLKAVKAFLERILREDRRVVPTPPSTVAVVELADFSVVFSVKCWVGTKDFGELRSALLERIKLGFDEEGFTFPYPSRDVYVHQSNSEMKKAG